MHDVHRHVRATHATREIELSERELFRLATGEAIQISLPGHAEPEGVQFTVTLPEHLADRE